MAKRYMIRGSKEHARNLREVAKLYEQGNSIRGISREMGLSFSVVHRLVHECGVVVRPRGSPSLNP